ncbi:alpha/beta fold hydrolase [Nocardia sp. NPDC059246]|uniref:alpha/beta fold hydrolase n=1 Tax=unclassified Nocardia TaxID=2637762 RepID=UPI00368F014B
MQVHYDIHGAEGGVPVLLVNALGCDLSIWDAFLNPLTDKGFRVIRHDLRGHGRSPVPVGPYEMRDFGVDILALLDQLGVESAHIVGLSLGAMAALWVACNHPDRVRGMVMCCTSANPGNARMWLDRAMQARTVGMRAIADATVARWFTSAWRAGNPEPATRMRELIAATAPEGYAASCEALASFDLSDDLARVIAPTLVLSMGWDPAFTPDHAKRIVDGIVDAKSEIIDGFGHLGTLVQPERFSRAIAAHLARAAAARD